MPKYFILLYNILLHKLCCLLHLFSNWYLFGYIFFFFFGNLKTHMCPVSSDLFSTCSNSTSLSGCIFSKTASIKMLILLKWNIFLFITRIMFVSFLGHLPYCILYFNYLYICLNFFFFLFLKIATYLLPIFLSW